MRNELDESLERARRRLEALGRAVTAGSPATDLQSALERPGAEAFAELCARMALDPDGFYDVAYGQAQQLVAEAQGVLSRLTPLLSGPDGVLRWGPLDPEGVEIDHLLEALLARIRRARFARSEVSDTVNAELVRDAREAGDELVRLLALRGAERPGRVDGQVAQAFVEMATSLEHRIERFIDLRRRFTAAGFRQRALQTALQELEQRLTQLLAQETEDIPDALAAVSAMEAVLTALLQPQETFGDLVIVEAEVDPVRLNDLESVLLEPVPIGARCRRSVVADVSEGGGETWIDTTVAAADQWPHAVEEDLEALVELDAVQLPSPSVQLSVEAEGEGAFQGLLFEGDSLRFPVQPSGSGNVVRTACLFPGVEMPGGGPVPVGSTPIHLLPTSGTIPGGVWVYRNTNDRITWWAQTSAGSSVQHEEWAPIAIHEESASPATANMGTPISAIPGDVIYGEWASPVTNSRHYVCVRASTNVSLNDGLGGANPYYVELGVYDNDGSGNPAGEAVLDTAEKFFQYLVPAATSAVAKIGGGPDAVGDTFSWYVATAGSNSWQENHGYYYWIREEVTEWNPSSEQFDTTTRWVWQDDLFTTETERVRFVSSSAFRPGSGEVRLGGVEVLDFAEPATGDPFTDTFTRDPTGFPAAEGYGIRNSPGYTWEQLGTLRRFEWDAEDLGFPVSSIRSWGVLLHRESGPPGDTQPTWAYLRIESVEVESGVIALTVPADDVPHTIEEVYLPVDATGAAAVPDAIRVRSASIWPGDELYFPSGDLIAVSEVAGEVVRLAAPIPPSLLTAAVLRQEETLSLRRYREVAVGDLVVPLGLPEGVTAVPNAEYPEGAAGWVVSGLSDKIYLSGGEDLAAERYGRVVFLPAGSESTSTFRLLDAETHAPLQAEGLLRKARVAKARFLGPGEEDSVVPRDIALFVGGGPARVYITADGFVRVENWGASVSAAPAPAQVVVREALQGDLATLTVEDGRVREETPDWSPGPLGGALHADLFSSRKILIRAGVDPSDQTPPSSQVRLSAPASLRSVGPVSIGGPPWFGRYAWSAFQLRRRALPNLRELREDLGRAVAERGIETRPLVSDATLLREDGPVLVIATANLPPLRRLRGAELVLEGDFPVPVRMEDVRVLGEDGGDTLLSVVLNQDVWAQGSSWVSVDVVESVVSVVWRALRQYFMYLQDILRFAGAVEEVPEPAVERIAESLDARGDRDAAQAVRTAQFGIWTGETPAPTPEEVVTRLENLVDQLELRPPLPIEEPDE